MKATCWQILAIAPTSNARVIKQAYAALLPENKPDKNPAGFIALREAYEQALAERVFYAEDLEDSEGEGDDSDTVEVDEFFAADDAGLNSSYDSGLKETSGYASNTSKTDAPFALASNTKPFNAIYEPLTQLEIWQYAWQQSVTLPDADLSLYQTLQKQFAQRHQLTLDEAFVFEERLLAWHFEHATDYPLSFEYCVQTLNWLQQASQIQTGAKFSDNWYDLYWLIDDYDSHNRAVFLQRRNQHIETARILESWENNWRISLINNSLLQRLEDDFDYSQGFDSQAQAYLSQTLLLWFHEQAELHVDAFEFAYQVFYWKYRLKAPDCYQFPWCYLPRLLERYEPQIALKNSLKITDIASFQRYIQQRYPYLFNRWFLDPHSPKPTIVITNVATTEVTNTVTLQPAKPSRRQLWAWRWQFIWAFKFAYNLYPITEQLQAIDAIIAKYAAEQTNIAPINNHDKAPSAAKSSVDVRSDVYYYWHGSVKLQQLYDWSTKGFIRPSLRLFVSIIVVALGMVVSISAIFKEVVGQWQHIALDTLVLTLILGFALIFWQWQLTLFADIQRFFERKQKLASYAAWVGGLWIIIMLLPENMLIGSQDNSMSGVIDGLQPVPSLSQIALFVIKHILGLGMATLLAYKTVDIYSVLGTWHIRLMITVMVLLTLMGWLLPSHEVLAFIPSAWLWGVLAIPLLLKVSAKQHLERSGLNMLAEIMIFFIALGALYMMVYSFYVIVTLFLPQMMVSAGMLILLLVLWGWNLFQSWAFCNGNADQLFNLKARLTR
jgi:hypothetical protein